MTTHNDELLSFDEYDEIDNPGPEVTDFDKVVDSALSRRGFMKGAFALGASAFVMGTTSLTSKDAMAHQHGLDFTPVPTSTADTVTVPSGYNWQPVVRWGDPLWSKGVEFNHETRGDAASQALSFGDNCDGMALFQIEGKNVLVVNNEYTNRGVIYGNRASGLPENKDDVLKGKYAHGVSVVEVVEKNGDWSIVKDSKFNRRITADTPMEITGPARGHDLMKTSADKTGTISLGTWNNCGNGETPWGTYLACEENFNGYYSASDENFKQTAEQKRYGLKSKDWGYNWAMQDDRFDLSKEPNEPHRCGYITEIDPKDPNSVPKKRTALGRFKHENAAVVIAADNHIVVYLGDDERGEFLYKFVSKHKYVEGGDNTNLLEEGTLHVAVFSDDMTGKWVPLTPETTGMTEAEISIFSRIAASKVGATTMDRPEWVAAHPLRAEAFCCLTNNKNRGVKPNAGGDDTSTNGPNPRDKNLYGQVVRWAPINGNHSSNDFSWSLFVTAGNPSIHTDAYAGSDNVTVENMFNSPDGLAFDSKGRLWIQTDGNYSNEGEFAGHGNNQMLVGDPDTGEIKRFLTGPNECEITGAAWSEDKATMFISIQHPGEKAKGNSHFPEGGNAVPRSTVIAIRRDDGKAFG